MIFFIYFFLLCGGLYNALDILQGIMHYLAPYFIAVLGVVTIVIFMKNFHLISDRAKSFTWLIFVFFSSIYIEHIGVKTGKVFGQYSYGNTLGIKIGEAPIVIGFAWIVTIISSWAVVRTIFKKMNGKPVLVYPVLIAVFMVFMDFWMEPAAIANGYWDWNGGQPPLLNYFSWGLLGWLYAFTGELLGIFNHPPHRYLIHIYLAQILYFIISSL